MTVIIPAFNEAETLPNLIDALCSNVAYLPDQIVIIDANSTDGTSERADRQAALYPHVNFVIHRVNEQTFPGKARNIGATLADQDLLAFIDCGVWPSQGWLRDLIEPFKAQGWAGEDLRMDMPMSMPMCVWGKTAVMPKSSWERAFSSLIETESGYRRVVPNMCIPASTHRKLGGFREDLRAGEDLLYKMAIQKQCLENQFKEHFVEASVHYNGYPPSVKAAYRKWEQYTAYSVKAGIYRSKLLFSAFQAILFMGILGMCLVVCGLMEAPMSFGLATALMGILVMQALLVYWRSKRSLYPVRGAKEHVYRLVIACAVDAGRTFGLIRGLVGNL